MNRILCLVGFGAIAGASACFDYTVCDFASCEGGQGGTGGTGGSSSSSSMMSSSTGVLPTCDPHSADYAPTAECGVFVKEGATGTGTPDSPVGTLADAVAENKTIYLCEGNYAGSVTVDNLSIYGGLNCTDWKHQAAVKSAVAGTANLPGLTVQGAGPIFIENLTVTSPNATTLGVSSIALFVNATDLDVIRTDLTAGNGAAGPPGVDAGAQLGIAPGGGLGMPAGSGTGGTASPINMCPDGNTNGGKGGDGGIDVDENGDSGNTGDMGTGANAGIGEVNAGWTCATGDGGGSIGTPGINATPGNGALSTEFGTLSSSAYANASGSDGGDGTRGKGGGGGGGSKAVGAVNGAGGGGGGAGGCGGLKGTAGGGAGSSIGIVSFNATVSLEDVRVSLGTGGVGGKGGNGQPGQNGGLKGSGGLAGLPAAGCDGGAGGKGGNGSSAGGGRGGHAMGVVFSGEAPTGSPTVTASGSAGMGGMGGTNGIDNATPGADGCVAPSQQVPAQ